MEAKAIPFKCADRLNTCSSYCGSSQCFDRKAASPPLASAQEAAPRITEAEARILNEAIRRYAMQEQKTAARKLIEALAAPRAPAPVQPAPTEPADWRIDTSAGGPILVYKNCSVIEAEQAQYVLNLITAAQEWAKQKKWLGDRICNLVLENEHLKATPAPVAAPAPVLPLQGAEINGKPTNAHSLLAALIDIYDDAQNNAPEHRCYVESAWPDVLKEARTFLAAPLHAEGGQSPTVEQAMEEAVAAGDGTLHGAIDYWQERALKAEAAVGEQEKATEGADWHRSIRTQALGAFREWQKATGALPAGSSWIGEVEGLIADAVDASFAVAAPSSQAAKGGRS